MGLRTTTDDKGIKVIRKDKVSKAGNPYTQYSLMTSGKDRDGNWHNAFINCSFRKGVEVKNKSVIKITDSWHTVDEYNGNSSDRIFVNEFEIITEGEDAPASAPGSDDFMNIPDGIEEELPFA